MRPPNRPIGAAAGARLVLFLAASLAGGTGCVAPPAERPAELREEARAAAAAGDLERAQELVERSLARAPRDAAGHRLCAAIHVLRGRRDLAVVGYERALAIDPTDAAVLYELGTLHLDDGDPLRAARLLEEAVRLRPDHAPSFNNLGKAYFLVGLPELAGPAFEEALALDPQNASARANLDLLREEAS